VRRSVPLLVAALAALITRAQADDERPAPRLGEVVVTAPAEDADEKRDPTAFTTVVDTAEAPMGTETLSEVLNEMAGVHVRRFGGLENFSTVSIRGSSPGQVQVYLDGIPLSRADNEVVNLANLALGPVERVEVYRGVTPLAFAQSAPGGVVNVVTRRPGPTPFTAASASVGSFATREVNAAHSAVKGPWEYLAFGNYFGTAGDFTFTNDLGTTANPADDRVERRQNNQANRVDLTGRLGWRPGGPLSATLTTDTFYVDRGVPGVGSIQALDTSLETFRQLGNLSVALASPRALPLEASGNLWVVYQRQHFDDPEGEIALVPEDVEQRTTAVGGQVLLRGAVGAHHLPGLLLAADHERLAERDSLSPEPPPPDRAQLSATIAAEDEITVFGDRLSVLPGLRWEIFRDDFPGDPSEPGPLRAGGVKVQDFLSPRIGVRVTPHPRLTLLSNLGRYARVPNLQELFGDRGVLVGNPALKPETAVNLDAGFRLQAPPLGALSGATLEYAYFESRVDDLILLVQNAQRIVRPENVTAASITGHELSLRGRLSERLGLFATYTHQRAVDDGDVTFLRGNQLPGRPADELTFRLELGWSPDRPLPLVPAPQLWPGRVFYELDFIAGNFLDRANERFIDNRLLHNLGLRLALPLPGVWLDFEVRNAGSDQTPDVLGFPVPGVSFYGTISYGFGPDGAAKRP